MPRKKQNRYNHQAKKAAFISLAHAPTKGNVKNTLLETGKDLLVGVVGGGILGAAIGKPSLLIGVGITAAGHYTEQRLISLLGIGMMAANGFQKTDTVNGLSGMDNVKDRLSAYKNGFVQKLYLDKVIKKKDAVSGFGELQYFSYPQEVNGELDFSEVNGIEDQIEQIGMAQLPMTDTQDVERFSDAEDYNF